MNGGGQHHQAQTAALVVPHHGPPISYLPAFHLPQTQPTAAIATEAEMTTPSVQSTSNSCSNSNINSNPPPAQHEQPLTTTPPQLQLAGGGPPSSTGISPDDPPPSPQNTCQKNTVVVPDIEDELSFLAEESESEGEIKNKVLAAPNSNAKYQDTYIKFIEGKKDSSPKLGSRPAKKSSWLKVKQVNEINDVIIKKPFPSDPLDDPRYYPHPKSVERSFETSDSEKETYSNNVLKDKKEKNKKKDDKHHQTSSKSSNQKNVEKMKETNKPPEKTSKDSRDDTPANNDKVLEIVSISESSDCSEPKLKKKKLPKLVIKTNRKPQRKETLDTPNNSDTDSVRKPRAIDDNRARRFRKKIHKVKLKNKTLVTSGNRARSPSSSSVDYSSGDEKSYKPPLRKFTKKKIFRKIVPTSEPLKKKFITVRMLPLNEMGKSESTKKTSSNETDPTKKSNTEDEVNKIKIRIVPQEKLINKTPKSGFPFEVGDYLLSSNDAKYYFPAIWRVKDQLMLHKFLHFVTTGDSLYKSVPFYTAWSSESPVIYKNVNIENVSFTRREAIVRLRSTNILKIPKGCTVIDECIKEDKKYQANFKVYIQALISQVLDSNFLTEVIKKKDQYFLRNIGKIDNYCFDLKQHLKLALNWNTILYTAIEKLPSYKTLVTVGKCFCGLKGNIEVTLEGEPYSDQTLEIIKEIQDSEVTTVLCNLCFEYYQILHKISHFKLYIYAICVRQVNFQTGRYHSKCSNDAIILKELLSDNDWLNKIFNDSCTFWAYITKIITEYS